MISTIWWRTRNVQIISILMSLSVTCNRFLNMTGKCLTIPKTGIDVLFHDSPLFHSFEKLWDEKLSDVYTKELSSLAYKTIPDSIVVLNNIQEIISRIESSGVNWNTFWASFWTKAINIFGRSLMDIQHSPINIAIPLTYDMFFMISQRVSLNILQA